MELGEKSEERNDEIFKDEKNNRKVLERSLNL